MLQISSASSKVDFTFGLPDLSSALRQIQSQYDSIAAKNLEVDGNYLDKLSSDFGEFVAHCYMYLCFCPGNGDLV